MSDNAPVQRTIFSSIVVIAGAFFASECNAAYPDRPVRWVLGFAAAIRRNQA
jgi:hypothetical protein